MVASGASSQAAEGLPLHRELDLEHLSCSGMARFGDSNQMRSRMPHWALTWEALGAQERVGTVMGLGFGLSALVLGTWLYRDII